LELLEQQLPTVEREPNSAVSEERILFDWHWQVGQWLVSTYVQGAEGDTAATQGVSDGEVFRDLLLEVGGPIAVEEQEFGTDQAGAVRSFGSRRVGVGARAEVGGDLDPRTVDGDGGFAGRGAVFALLCSQFSCPLAEVRQRGGRRVDDELAGGAVDGDGGPFGQAEYARSCRNEGRDAA
jgi:hypothetical protein